MTRPFEVRFTRLDAAIGFYGAFAGALSFFPLRDGHLWVIVAILVAPAAVLLRQRPYLAATVVIVGSVVLRVAYIEVFYADQIDLSHAASARAFTGNNPYGIAYAVESGAPYSYGPLGLLWWLPGIPIEVAGAAGTMALLAHQRAWLTFGFTAAWPFMVYLTTSGINDYSAGFVLLLALVLLRSHSKVGMAALALATAIKPYAAAWLIPAAAFGGMSAFGVFVVVSAVLWAPVLLVWGVPSYVASVRGVESIRATLDGAGDAGSINAPLLRWLVVPLAVAGAWLRSWRATMLLGAASFFAFLFFSPWTSGGYWVALLPIVGLALERRG